MNRFLIYCMLGLMLGSSWLFAAFQFNESDVMVNHILRKENYLTFDGKTDVYLDFDSKIYDFGYYQLGLDSTAESGKFIQGDRKNGYLGSFDAGDRIGIWIKPKGYGSYYYTSTKVESPTQKTKFVGTEYEVELEDDEDEVEIEFVVGNRLKWDDGAWEVSGIEFDILAPFAGENGAVPSGQPLPRGLMTLLVAAAVIGGCFYYEKRKKNSGQWTVNSEQ